MTLIGKIEQKEGKTATILVKKIAPCGDKCKNCSAGCNLYSTHIQTEVADDVNVGDYVEIRSDSDVVINNSIMQYAVPVILIIISTIVVQLLPFFQNKEMATALAVVLSLIASQFVLKFIDKNKMQNNARLFHVGKKYNKK